MRLYEFDDDVGVGFDGFEHFAVDPGGRRALARQQRQYQPCP
jgi:hypothetical protein